MTRLWSEASQVSANGTSIFLHEMLASAALSGPRYVLTGSHTAQRRDPWTMSQESHPTHQRHSLSWLRTFFWLPSLLQDRPQSSCGAQGCAQSGPSIFRTFPLPQSPSAN